ncbi:MAG: D-alanyl-D-alanine carboxypeptidase/D-alanyl-D-alanine-endopeptidase [Solirubrobacteraceae bacterium]
MGSSGSATSGSVTTAAASVGGGSVLHTARRSHRSWPDIGRPRPRTPAEAQLERLLGRQLRIAGRQSGALVVDLSTGQTLFQSRAGIGRAPASVEKLWTTVATLQRLGPRARFHTTLLGTGSQRGGVWRGDLYLHGGGDPTFSDTAFDQAWYENLGPTPNELARQLLARGIRRVSGRLYADESLFDRRRGGLLTNQLADLPDLAGQLSALTFDHGATARHYNPATFAAREVALTLRDSGIRVTASRQDRRAPRRARLLATVSSAPISDLIRFMDVPSDDLIAELLAKQLGVLFGAGGTIAAGAHVISATIASDYGLHPKILDGSGLSLNDRSSPLEIVDLLSRVYRTPTGRLLETSLPTVGRSGTVQGIADNTAAAGNCFAKTGTLTDVTNLAGYCNARGRHVLAFAFFVDGPSNAAAIPLIGRMVATIARY